jgi:hypothetical protein
MRGGILKAKLRHALHDSHVGAAIIAALLLMALDIAFRALWVHLVPAIEFSFTAVAILDIPLMDFGFSGRFLLRSFMYLYAALFAFGTAWLLSRWLYGARPLRALITIYDELKARKHA